ncbi:thioredoxin [bacterium]|nr:thioredoxin [bacterium]
MSNLAEINQDNFEAEVTKATLPVLVDFGAVWCGPCKMLDPIVEQLAEEWTGRVKVVHIDVDHNPDLAMQYNVMGVPTLMLFKDGAPLERMSGYKPKNKIVSLFEPHL